MEPIIDVEYREVSDLTEKTTEELRIETNVLWNQFKAIESTAAMMMVQAGKRLRIIKKRLHHGEWEKWCENNLEFSKSKAEKMMLLAQKAEDENSIFAKTETFTDLQISKVWALLAAPEEVAEQVVKNEDVSDMTVKELKEELKRYKEANEEKSADLDRLEQELTEAKAKAEDAEKRVKVLQEQAKEVPPANTEEIERLEKELAGAKEELLREKEKVKEAKANADAQRISAVEAARKQAADEAKKKFNEESELLRSSNRQAAEEIERLQRQVKNSQNTVLVEFKLKSRQLQVDFNECIASITDVKKADPQQAEKMKNALKIVMTKLMEELND